ncbi:MAG: EAL domain-containing protein, partial [Mailhella sp.]|nr:EAL domain-containing protein [Mailhella sp.]
VFTAPERLLLHSLPTLRLWNLFMNALSVLLVGFLLVDIIVLQTSYSRKLRMTENTDPLTLGPNASSFAEQVASRLQQSGGRYAVVSLDINKFKLINDGHGIDKANELLRLIYGVLESRLKNGELCARSNADTFLLFLRCTAPSALRQRLNALVAELLRRKKDLDLNLAHGLSVGVYVVEDRYLPPVSMIDRANFARTISKDTIGTPVTFYDAAAGESLRKESELLNAFRSGMESGELFIELQPKVNIRTDLVAGAEALVRWRHPERGLLSPSEFLPALEKAGRIVELDLWVFEQVCALLARWDSEGREVVPISVNLSRTHLSDENFLNNYLKILQKYEVKPHWLELELTESIFVEDQEDIAMTFAAIRSHGLRCSIDDFGTGYSSLSLLKNANVDMVKLDRTFFEEDELNEQTCSILMSIIQLATALGFTCVAEGVEKRSTVEFLMRTDCALVQGWVYSRALPVEEFERYAFDGEKRRRLLGSGHREDQPRLPMPGGGRNVRHMVQALNSLGEVGVFVVKKVSREILFCNEVIRRRSGVANPEGQFCHVLWGETCGQCPVASAGEQPCVDMPAMDSVFGCPVRKTATEIMWDDSIPAYLVVLVPERLKAAAEDDEEELERLRLQASLWKRKAQEDDLTSLLGRTQFKAEVERRMRNRKDGVLLFIDLDSFKQVNDRFGHQMGDVVLKNTSERIRLSFRSDDLIGRFGGDEFVVYASGFTDGELLTQRILTLLNLLRHPHSHGSDTVSISASIGVASYPLDAKNYKELERSADAALYEAKRRGKDQHVRYSEIKEAAKPEAKERKDSAKPEGKERRFRRLVRPDSSD